MAFPHRAPEDESMVCAFLVPIHLQMAKRTTWVCFTKMYVYLVMSTILQKTQQHRIACEVCFALSFCQFITFNASFVSS